MVQFDRLIQKYRVNFVKKMDDVSKYIIHQSS